MFLLDFAVDTGRSLAFLSRLRVPARAFEGFDGRYVRTARAFPVAGLAIALPPALLAIILVAMGAAPLFAATAAVALSVIVTGALHEDGLADTADGIGGGRDRERALMIMKDSRIGTYGTLSLVLALALRISALAGAFAALGPVAAGAGLLAAAALSRAAMVWHWHHLPPARSDGAAVALGRPDRSATGVALATGMAAALLLVAGTVSVGTGLAALTLAATAAVFFTGFVRRRIAGHTGDTIGATQQVVEVAVLSALAVAA
ncbi:adenosylcobinamide-GDP ribazoletransferase [Ensifer soli]|uniref:adenosylcobinamide-GDP ribazoletransferase n=1 Tax=Ciceribacter sp. sgz301302 TaxID=3342379 RepID=UPI0035B72DC8